MGIKWTRSHVLMGLCSGEGAGQQTTARTCTVTGGTTQQDQLGKRRQSLSEEMSFGQRLNEGVGGIHSNICRRNIPNENTDSQCLGGGSARVF